jgi:hypothetical protein
LPTHLLLIKNALKTTNNPFTFCCALNVTDKHMHFRKHTPVVSVSPAVDAEGIKSSSPLQTNALPSYVTTATELNKIVISSLQTLLSANNKQQIVAFFLRRYRFTCYIITGDPRCKFNHRLKLTHPIRVKTIGHSQHCQEIARSVSELLEAEIVQER